MRQLILKAAALGMLRVALASASSSGLNNIPTADTAPHLTVVFQEYSFYKSNASPSHVVAFKTGIDPWAGSAVRNRFEWGVDSVIGEGGAGPGVLQAKWAVDVGHARPSLSVGTANVALTAEGRRTAGQPFSFFVLTEDLGKLRLHGGYALQAGRNNTALLGVDRTVKAFRRDLMLRADAVQTAHQENWETSAGFVYSIHRHFALESWGSQPVHGGHSGFMVKLDLIVP